MKKITLATVMMFLATALTAQPNIISTSFYSEALDETKMVNVFLPPGYDENPDLYYPVIYYLHGWQGAQNSGDGVMNTANSMINQGLIEPVIIVCAHNSPAPFGGSVYVNSILWGDYETYMVEDLCNWIEATYRAMPGKHYRAVFGMSMGGYGAFRYGILHNDKYCALASCAAPVSFLEDYMFAQFRQMILQANQPGPPYTYNFTTGGPFTQIYFLYYGAFAPNYNTPQTYINPAILEFPLDENANKIDTILAKVIPHDIASLIHQLTPENSPGIYFGCGTNDQFFLYPGNLDVTDSLNLYGIPYTFYSHGGGHTMPSVFTQNALIFLDSLLMPPTINLIYGDANCDGLVNLLDAITTANYIMNANPEPFCFENADVNNDGQINVNDLIGTINIILSGKKSLVPGVNSSAAHIWLNRDNISLQSDGTLAGLQFEIAGLEMGQLSLALPGYEFVSSVKDGILTGLIFSYDNTPLPAGNITLFNFAETAGLKWGNVIGGNINAENVAVNAHQVSEIQLAAFPNPARGQFTVEVSIPQTSEALITITDMTGREVQKLHQGILARGVYRYDLNLIRSGLYFLQVHATGGNAEFMSRYLKVVITE